jgi:hypothetical protein
VGYGFNFVRQLCSNRLILSGLLLGLMQPSLLLSQCAALKNVTSGERAYLWVPGPVVTVLAILHCDQTSCDDESHRVVQQLNSISAQHNPDRVRVLAVIPGEKPISSNVTNLYYDWHLQFDLLAGKCVVSEPRSANRAGPTIVMLNATGKTIATFPLPLSAAFISLQVDGLLNSIKK